MSTGQIMADPMGDRRPYASHMRRPQKDTNGWRFQRDECDDALDPN